MTDIVQVAVDQSGTGTSKESFSYLVSILQISTLPLIFALYSFSPSTLFPVSHWESHPNCVSWMLTDVFYESEECKCVGIFKHSYVLQLSTIVIPDWLPAKINMPIVGMSLCSEFITGRVELSSIVLMNFNPHSLPLDLEHSASGNTQVSLFFYLLFLFLL